MSLIDIVDTAGDSRAEYIKCSASRMMFNGGVFLAVVVVVVIILLIAGARGALPVVLIIGVLSLLVVSIGILSIRWSAGREYDIAREELSTHLSAGLDMSRAKERMRADKYYRDMRRRPVRPASGLQLRGSTDRGMEVKWNF